MEETIAQAYLQRHFRLFLALSLLSSAVLYLLINSQGLGMTYDSYLYLGIAEELGRNTFWDTAGLQIKPPLFPLLIYWLGSENIIWVQLIFLLLSQYFILLWIKKIPDHFMQWIYGLLMIFSTPILLVHAFFWTEPFFLLLLATSFYLLMNREVEKWQEKPSALILLMVLLLVMPFVRFAAIFVVWPIFVLLFIRLNKGLRKIVFFVFIGGLLVISLWVLLYSEGFLGRWVRFMKPFELGSYSHISHNFGSYLKAMSSWFVPYSLPDPILYLVAGAFIIFILVYFFKSRATPLRVHYFSDYLPVLFVLYLVPMVMIFRVEYYSAERYIAPFYPWMIFYCIKVVSRFRSRRIKTLIRVASLSLVLYSVVRTMKNLYFWQQLRAQDLTEHLDQSFSLF